MRVWILRLRVCDRYALKLKQSTWVQNILCWTDNELMPVFVCNHYPFFFSSNYFYLFIKDLRQVFKPSPLITKGPRGNPLKSRDRLNIPKLVSDCMTICLVLQHSRHTFSALFNLSGLCDCFDQFEWQKNVSVLALSSQATCTSCPVKVSSTESWLAEHWHKLHKILTFSTFPRYKFMLHQFS